jgi:hypothetical protein
MKKFLSVVVMMSIFSINSLFAAAAYPAYNAFGTPADQETGLMLAQKAKTGKPIGILGSGLYTPKPASDLIYRRRADDISFKIHDRQSGRVHKVKSLKDVRAVFVSALLIKVVRMETETWRGFSLIIAEPLEAGPVEKENRLLIGDEEVYDFFTAEQAEKMMALKNGESLTREELGLASFE